MSLPHELTTASNPVKAGIRAALGILSAALRNTGTAENEVPLLGSGGKLAVSLIPTGILEGLIPILGTGGKLPLSVIPDGVGGGGGTVSAFATKIVADQAARLALTSEEAESFIVLEADTGKSWGLITDGVPATSGDWLQIGDRDIVMTDVAGLVAALAGKAGINGELINASAFRTALGLDSLDLVNVVPVANAVARLALSADAARNALVRETDTGISYMLISAGVPANSGDWLKVADITPAIADVTGLVDALDDLDDYDSYLQVQVNEITPAYSETEPVDSSTDAFAFFNAGESSEANLHYENYGLLYNGKRIYSEVPDYLSSYRFIYSGFSWELYSAAGVLLANAAEGDEASPADAVGWSGDGAFSWEEGSFTPIYGSLGTMMGENKILRVGEFDFRCDVRDLNGTSGYFWTALAPNGHPMNSQPFFPGGTPGTNDINGYLRYTLGGTTSPASAGQQLQEVIPVDFFTPAGVWTTDGTLSFLGDEIGNAGVRVVLRRSGDTWSLKVYNDNVLSQVWEAFLTDSPDPDQASSWTYVSGPVTAGPTLTKNLYRGLPGRVGQVYAYDFLIGDERSNAFELYVCTREAPYSIWAELPTNPSTFGKEFLKVADAADGRTKLQAMGRAITTEGDLEEYPAFEFSMFMISGLPGGYPERAGNYYFAGYMPAVNGGYRQPVILRYNDDTTSFDPETGAITGDGAVWIREMTQLPGSISYLWTLQYSSDWAINSPDIWLQQGTPSTTEMDGEWPSDLTGFNWYEPTDDVSVVLSCVYTPGNDAGTLAISTVYHPVEDYPPEKRYYIARRENPTIWKRIPGFPFTPAQSDVSAVEYLETPVSGSYYLDLAKSRHIKVVVTGDIAFNILRFGEQYAVDRGDFKLVFTFEDTLHSVTFPDTWVAHEDSQAIDNRLATYIVHATIADGKVFYRVEEYFVIDEGSFTETLYAIGDLGQDTGPAFTQGVDYLLAKNTAGQLDYLLYAGDVNYDVGSAGDMAGNLGGLSALVTAEKILPCHGNHDLETTSINWSTESSPLALGTPWRWSNTNQFASDFRTNAATSAGWSVVTPTGGVDAVPGFGETDSADITDNDSVTYYFAKVVNLGAAPAAGKRLRLQMYIDDGAMVYINGILVYDFNVEYPVSHTSTAHQAISATVDGDLDFLERTLHTIYVDAACMVSGDNLIAVVLKQTNTTSSDVSWDLAIDIGSSTSAIPPITDDIKFVSGKGQPLRDTFSYLPNGLWAYHQVVGTTADVFVLNDGYDNGNVTCNPLTPYPNGAMHEWFVNALAASSNPFKIVVIHRCCVSTYNSSSYWNDALDWPEFKAPNVLLVFGHTHQTCHYSHTSGQHIINASNCGGQAPRAIVSMVGVTTGYTTEYADASTDYAVARIDLSPDFLRVKFEKTLDGEVLHQFVMAAP